MCPPLDFIRVTANFEQQAPGRCPRCESAAVAPIVYGLPSGQLLDSAGRGEIVLGGCIVGPQEWACLACGYLWPLPPEALEATIVCHALYLVHRAFDEDESRVKHGIEVAHALFEAGYEAYVVAAGVLCETISAGALTAAEIADEAGAPAAALVEAVSERGDIPSEDRRKLELRARVARAGGRVAAVYAAHAVCRERTLSQRCPLHGALAGELVNIDLDRRMLARLDNPPPFLRA